jgi:membrane glycosyltransferase
MLPEELDRTPWMSIIKKTFRRLFNALPSVPLRASWKDSAERQLQQKEWGKVAGRRRTLLMTLILVPAIIGAFIMYNIFPDQGIEAVKVTTSVLFAILFGWISIGFWMCAAGCWQLMRRTASRAT